MPVAAEAACSSVQHRIASTTHAGHAPPQVPLIDGLCLCEGVSCARVHCFAAVTFMLQLSGGARRGERAGATCPTSSLQRTPHVHSRPHCRPHSCAQLPARSQRLKTRAATTFIFTGSETGVGGRVPFGSAITLDNPAVSVHTCAARLRGSPPESCRRRRCCSHGARPVVASRRDARV